jgi:hypothetical protein
MKTSPTEPNGQPDADKPTWLNDVRRQVQALRFGVVQIVVHDSRVVQIETTERVRYGTTKSSDAE